VKITFVLPEHGAAGGNRVVAIYAALLQRRGHDVTVVAPPREKPSYRERLKSLLHIDGWQHYKEADYDYYEGGDHRVVTLERHRPVEADDVPDADVIVATWWKTVEWVNKMPSSKGARVHFIQGYDASEFSPEALVDATWRLPFFKIAVSRWLAEVGRQKIGVEVDAIIHNGVDTEHFSAPERDKNTTPTVGFLFSDFAGKGTDDAIAILTTLKAEMPMLKALCFGRPSPGCHPHLPGWVEFLHNPPQPLIPQLYARCDVWFYPSHQDGFGLTPLEAMACRCPVVTTKVGAMPQLVRDGYNGFLADCGDDTALAAGVRQVLQADSRAWRMLSDNAHLTASAYQWDDAVSLFEAALERAKAGNRTLEVVPDSSIANTAKRSPRVA